MWGDLNEMHKIARDRENSGCHKTASTWKKMHRRQYWNFEERLMWQQLQVNTVEEKSNFQAKYGNPCLLNLFTMAGMHGYAQEEKKNTEDLCKGN